MPGSTAGLLAAWATAYLQGAVPLDDVLEHVLGHKSSAVRQQAATIERAPWEQPGETVVLVPPGDALTLSELLIALRDRGVRRLDAAFPMAGDAAGVGPGAALAPAYAAGSAVLLEPLGLVAVVTQETEDAIELTLFTSRSRVQYVSVSEAAAELTEAIHRSTAILTDLDVASWDPRLGRVSRRALDEVGAHPLPAGCPPRASHLLVRAHQLEVLLNAAAADPGGGAVSGHEAAARDRALAPLRRQIARALTAAYNSLPHE
ncbi:hypothetical protein [Cumulibacter manganitolerans]|uniref:hypothetical protein n=1 Tax=Cumulibacter manganitolerans TaxID=1884992 RepID=UPI001297F5C5|nr:hypothetical protein [Cumulibacter manganitolerans]